MQDVVFPSWLAGNDFKFDIFQILEDSCYYPYGNLQGAPVKILIKKTYSFVFIEYGVTEGRFIEEIKENGFKGYTIIHEQDIPQSLLSPNGLVKFLQPNNEDDYVSRHPHPFCKWYIFENKAENLRFSFLFLTADAVAAYQALYFSNKVQPRFLVFDYPRGNDIELQTHWRGISKGNSFFERVILSDIRYSPKYISFDDACWSSYSNHVEDFSFNFHIYRR